MLDALVAVEHRQRQQDRARAVGADERPRPSRAARAAGSPPGPRARRRGREHVGEAVREVLQLAEAHPPLVALPVLPDHREPVAVVLVAHVARDVVALGHVPAVRRAHLLVAAQLVLAEAHGRSSLARPRNATRTRARADSAARDLPAVEHRVGHEAPVAAPVEMPHGPWPAAHPEPSMPERGPHERAAVERLRARAGAHARAASAPCHPGQEVARAPPDPARPGLGLGLVAQEGRAERDALPPGAGTALNTAPSGAPAALPPRPPRRSARPRGAGARRARSRATTPQTAPIGRQARVGSIDLRGPGPGRHEHAVGRAAHARRRARRVPVPAPTQGQAASCSWKTRAGRVGALARRRAWSPPAAARG